MVESKPDFSKLSPYAYNLIAKLLEDRANFCVRNANDCREHDAEIVAKYWNEQNDIATDLALQFRQAGSDAPHLFNTPKDGR